ncbi:MAG: penicillin-binding protein [Candidatus Bostrichicola ureolyticus]|nr:MAG: penicillin-binding protein [Candidatus Bostrichicola ureolyticus]
MNKKQIYIFWIVIISLFIYISIIIHKTIKTIPKNYLSLVENLVIEKSSSVYDINNKLLGKFTTNSKNINYNKLPNHLINALIAKEDIRFKNHSGIDGRSLLRVIFFLGFKGGGSTISQQVIKLLYTRNPNKNKFKRIRQKIIECFLAVQLEKIFTKEEIISIYLNRFDFLFNSQGIYNAAKTYFNKNYSKLNLNESAILVGMLSNPRNFNPILNPKKCIKQRNIVLFKMKKYGFINNEIYKKAINKSIKINFNLSPKKNEFETYYAEFIKSEVNNFIKEYKKKTGNILDINSSGLKIYTSIDSNLQKKSESSVKQNLMYIQKKFFLLKNIKNIYSLFKKHKQILLNIIRNTKTYIDLKNNGLSEKEIMIEFNKKHYEKIFTWEGEKKIFASKLDILLYYKSLLQVAMLSIEPNTGYIKSWIGGRDFNYFKYDNVQNSKRQIGSVFKPLVYATAILKFNYTPNTRISNDPLYLKYWTPKNYNNKYGGFFTIKESLAYSLNTVAVRLILKTTPQEVINLAHQIGIKSYIPNNITIALGSANLTLYEITYSFNVFQNHGIYIKPRILLKIKNRLGKVIADEKTFSISKKEVLNKKVSDMVFKLMEGVADFGTAKSLRQRYGIKNQLACKTGTTNKYTDFWFVGLTPKLTTTIWVGWEYPFLTTLGKYYYNISLRIWAHLNSEKKLEFNLKNFN